MNIWADPLTEKNDKFLNALEDMFDSIETINIFKPHLKKMKPVFYEAQRSVKKHVANVSNIADLEQKDEWNIFDILENM